MNRTSGLLGFGLIVGGLCGAGLAQQPSPLKVAARVAAVGPFFAGQSIEIRVEVDGIQGVPDVEPPRIPETDAAVHRLPKDESAPASARFAVVARRPGTLLIPPFRASVGDRPGASRPTRLAIEGLPAGGRSKTFLGGVGAFEVKSEAEPARLRLGASLEYRLRLTGSAAWGSDRAPDVGEWASVAPGLRVEPLPGVLEPGEPAVRTFRYRVRPGRAGRLALPPVSVASFDPVTRRYSTRVAPGRAIEVEAPPGFDPGSIAYGPDRAQATKLAWWAIGLGLGIAGATTLLAAWLFRGRDGSSSADPRATARELIAGLVGDDPAREVAEALAMFLQRVGGRSPGVLTPPEARRDVERLTLDPAMAGRAERLVAACDRARFGGEVGEGGSLIAEGRAILEELGERSVPGGPREAAETART